MAHSYTPGLAVADRTVVRRRRLLPLPGTLLVKNGDVVTSHQAVARAELPGKVYPINLANQLSIAPDEITDYLVKKQGDAVQKDEILAENKPFIKWFKTEVRSPVAGTLESLSTVTGQVLLREPPRVLNLLAYIDGRVVETIPQALLDRMELVSLDGEVWERGRVRAGSASARFCSSRGSRSSCPKV